MSIDNNEITNWFAEASIDQFRKDMLRFASLQLRDQDHAEDMVQDALLIAFDKRDSFRGQAQIKTWVFSILRNRIIDWLRSRKHQFNLADVDHSDEQIDALFRENDHWHKHSRPVAFAAPDEAMHNDQFWIVFEICMNKMNENIAQVFSMREFLGLETAQICEQLNISDNNCWTLLHRARSRLRLCLQSSWND